MQRKKKTRVFISYSHADSSFAKKLEGSLREQQIDVWIDREEILIEKNIKLPNFLLSKLYIDFSRCNRANTKKN